jgi:hypothetical protein
MKFLSVITSNFLSNHLLQSFSAEIVGGDGRIREAHCESVNEMLKKFEKYLQAPGGGPPSRHDFCLNRSGYVKPLK